MRCLSHPTLIPFVLHHRRLLLLGAALLLTMSTAQAYQSRSSSSQARRILQAQRQRTAAQLQQQWTAATRAMEMAGGELTSAEAAAKSATAQVDSARDAYESEQRQVAAASQQMREQEERVLQAQPADSPYAKLAGQMDQQQREQDRLMHEVLGVPRTVPAAEETDQLRKAEALQLTAEQRGRLKAHPEYAAATEQLSRLSAEAKSLVQSLLESDKDWKAARDAHHDAVERRTDADKALRDASGDAARARRHLKEVSAVYATARIAAATAESQLRQLGVKPTRPQDK